MTLFIPVCFSDIPSVEIREEAESEFMMAVIVHLPAPRLDPSLIEVEVHTSQSALVAEEVGVRVEGLDSLGVISAQFEFSVGGKYRPRRIDGQDPLHCRIAIIPKITLTLCSITSFFNEYLR